MTAQHVVDHEQAYWTPRWRADSLAVAGLLPQVRDFFICLCPFKNILAVHAEKETSKHICLPSSPSSCRSAIMQLHSPSEVNVDICLMAAHTVLNWMNINCRASPYLYYHGFIPSISSPNALIIPLHRHVLVAFVSL